jgi:hypothetical protein
MNVVHQMLLQITLDVCGSRLGQSRVRVLHEPEIAPFETCFEGSIRITGEWEIELRVVCPKSVAVGLAKGMYDKSSDDLSDENLRDAMSEVICVVGSEVQHALGGRNALSIPRVRATVSTFNPGQPSTFGNFHGDVLTVHLAEATQGGFHPHHEVHMRHATMSDC